MKDQKRFPSVRRAVCALALVCAALFSAVPAEADVLWMASPGSVVSVRGPWPWRQVLMPQPSYAGAYVPYVPRYGYAYARPYYDHVSWYVPRVVRARFEPRLYMTPRYVSYAFPYAYPYYYGAASYGSEFPYVSYPLGAYAHPRVIPHEPVAYAAPAVEAWDCDARFAAVAAWRNHVDRMGVLGVSAVPVAWKGNAPKMIYAWVGDAWQQIPLRKWQRPEDALENHLYGLTRAANRLGTAMGAPEVGRLAGYAAAWGYLWMGWIYP